MSIYLSNVDMLRLVFLLSESLEVTLKKYKNLVIPILKLDSSLESWLSW